ncbi:SOS response-associated peptidase family protein [Arthrobacter halodurans]|uniref:Abasic site processing protein n=1 Tax=Arthrobacter halodurans TaxID=516699 RepID=A0ABV4UKX7_9MICC
MGEEQRCGCAAINARSETVLEKPTFRSVAVRRRALVPADGYYESQDSGTGKIPMFMHSEDGGVVAFAGLYEFWRDPAVPGGGEWKWMMTATILTRSAADASGHIHDRTPVIEPKGLREERPDPGITHKGEIRSLLDAIPDPHCSLAWWGRSWATCAATGRN